jgi:hypothetical protein
MRRSLRLIARHLGRSASTVSREFSRNGEATGTQLPGQIKPPGIGRVIPSCASCLATRS